MFNPHPKQVCQIKKVNMRNHNFLGIIKLIIPDIFLSPNVIMTKKELLTVSDTGCCCMGPIRSGPTGDSTFLLKVSQETREI